MRRTVVVAALLLTTIANAQPRTPLTRALADALYCRLTACVTTAAADLRYLKLAADNDPLTAALSGSAGTAALPSFSFVGETDTGMYLFGVNSIGFPVGGVDKWVMSSSGGLNCATDGGCDIGNGAADPRDLSLRRSLILRGATSGTVTISAPAVAGSATIATDTLLVSGGALGTPSSGVATNLTGTAAGLTAGAVTTNANLTGPITSTGNGTAVASQTGTGTTFVMSVGPTFTGTPVLAAPTATTIQTSGNVGFGVAPSAVSGVWLTAQSTTSEGAYMLVKNTDAVGTAALASILSQADAATVQQQAHGTGRVVTRGGHALGGYAEIALSGGNGLMVGTIAAKPLELYANNIIGFQLGATNAHPSFPVSDKRVTTQFDTTTTTLANITGLTVTLTAGKTYDCTSRLVTTSNIGGGVKFAISGTATATAIVTDAMVDSAGVPVAIGTARALAMNTTVGDVTAVTAATAFLYTTITVNAAGTLTTQFAENAAVATSSVLVGSIMSCREVQ